MPPLPRVAFTELSFTDTGYRMSRLKEIVEDNSTLGGRAFDLAIHILIVVSIASFLIQTLPNLSATAQNTLRYINVATVGVFTIEYVLRLVVADSKTRFATSFFGVVDLVAILPFYIATGIDLRAVRCLRLLLIFRALQLVRFSRAMQRFRKAFHLVREELILFFFVTGLLLLFAGSGIYFFENPRQPEAFASIFHGLWWAVSTLTTVGYGDVYPVTVGGKVFTSLLLLIGVAVISVPTGLLASALTKARFSDLDE